MGRSLSSRGAATLTRGKFHAQSLRLQGDFLTKNHSCARRIRAWRGLRRPKQKLPLFPNNQFISCTIENVGSAWVSRIGVRSIPARARENDRGFFIRPHQPKSIPRVCRKSCCRIKTQPFTNRFSTPALRIVVYLPRLYPASHNASTSSFLRMCLFSTSENSSRCNYSPQPHTLSPASPRAGRHSQLS